MMYPNSWAEVYYLVRKEIRERSDLPALNLEDIHKLSNLFWRDTKQMLRNTDTDIELFGFLNFKRREKQIAKANYKKNKLKEQYEKEKNSI